MNEVLELVVWMVIGMLAACEMAVCVWMLFRRNDAGG